MHFTKTGQMVSLLILGLGLAVNGYSQSFLTNGLVAYYPFNGNANDESGLGNNGTVFDAQLTTDRFNIFKHAYNFTNEIDSKISVADSVSLTAETNQTISLWFKYIEPFASHDESLLWKAEGTFPAYTGWWLDIDGFGDTYSLHFDRGTPTFFVTVKAILQYAQLQAWNHVAVVDRGNAIDLFLNGSLVNKTNTSASVRSTAPLIIGGSIHPVSGAYNRNIDDVRIYNRALSANEVGQLYEYESGPRIGLLKAVKPIFSGLSLGTNYQLQLSGDMNSWTNQGSPFTATNMSMVYPQYFDVENWGQLFFQLKATP